MSETRSDCPRARFEDSDRDRSVPTRRENASNVIERRADCAQCHEHVIEEIRGLFGGAGAIPVGARDHELGGFLTQLLEPQIAIVREPPRLAWLLGWH